MLPTHALALSAIQLFMQEKVAATGCALGENRTHEVDFSRLEDNLPSHRERRVYRRPSPPTQPAPATLNLFLPYGKLYY